MDWQRPIQALPDGDCCFVDSATEMPYALGMSRFVKNSPICAARQLLMLLAIFAIPETSFAGGGGEGVFVVVNSRSWASLTVANHFVALRGIPPSHVLHLDWGGDNHRVDLGTFRERLLGPALAAIEERGLDDQIDCLAWSSDFPWSIEVATERQQKLPAQYGSRASLTSLTFFRDMVMSGDPNFVGDQANHYFSRSPNDDLHNAPASRAFRRWHGWDADGAPNEAGGDAYLLSSVLAITSGEGIAADEAVALLARSAAIDGAKPDGAFYFAKNSDVRSTTRDAYFAPVVASLKELGKRAEIVDGALPMGKKDVQGAMLGAAAFHWKTSRSQLLPGAICEHLTSFGAIFDEAHGQTTLSELLRNGAAGSSGTVEEPYAIQAKFPTPWMHLHYARGCSLAESFYQSVQWPFQLLVVGDPLCQPFACLPRVTLAEPAPPSPWSGRVELTARLEATGERPVERWEWFVDGMRYGAGIAGENLALDTTRLRDGHHELLIVGVENGPIASRGRLVIPFEVRNAGREAHCERLSGERAVRWGEAVEFRVTAPGAVTAEVLHGRRTVARVDLMDGGGAVIVDTRLLGTGPVTLDVRVHAGNANAAWYAPPIALDVQNAAALPSLAATDGEFAPGLQVVRADGTRGVVERTAGDWLREANVAGDETYQVLADFDVPEDDVYQFQCQHHGALAILVDGVEVYSHDDGPNELAYAPVSLAAGRHSLVVKGARAGGAPVVLRFGSRGVRDLHSGLFVYPE